MSRRVKFYQYEAGSRSRKYSKRKMAIENDNGVAVEARSMCAWHEHGLFFEDRSMLCRAGPESQRQAGPMREA